MNVPKATPSCINPNSVVFVFFLAMSLIKIGTVVAIIPVAIPRIALPMIKAT